VSASWRSRAAIGVRHGGLGQRADQREHPGAQSVPEVEGRPRRIDHGLDDHVWATRLAAHGARRLELEFAPKPSRQVELPLAQQVAAEAAPHASSPGERRPEHERVGASDAVASATYAPREPPLNLPAGDRRCARWTRDTIIGELATGCSPARRSTRSSWRGTPARAGGRPHAACSDGSTPR
jgi:hypothetical protein